MVSIVVFFQESRLKEISELEEERANSSARIKILEESVAATEGEIEQVEADTKVVDGRAEEVHKVSLEQVSIGGAEYLRAFMWDPN